MTEEDMNLANEVSEFLINTCLVRDNKSLHFPLQKSFLDHSFERHPVNGLQCRVFPFCTGSVAEFYIEPMLSCLGDIDIMQHYSNEFAIPEGILPPLEPPSNFDGSVEGLEIVDSDLHGYVYLRFNCVLSRKSNKEQYSVQYVNKSETFRNHGLYVRVKNEDRFSQHGPATRHHQTVKISSVLLTDVVPCIRCLYWPSQAANWPTRQRNSGWPNSATINAIVADGCDLVGVSHPSCADDEQTRNRQWRLSFSRAEVILLNNWKLEQQIVYHMLRIFVKTERLTEKSKEPGIDTFSNYHIKTLMLWASELNPLSWWKDGSNLVKICIKVMQSLREWLIKWRGQHYFIDKVRFSDYFDSCDVDTIIAISESTTVDSLSDWFVRNYVQKCAELCPDKVSLFCSDLLPVASVCTAIPSILNWRHHVAGQALIEHSMCIYSGFKALSIDPVRDSFRWVSFAFKTVRDWVRKYHASGRWHNDLPSVQAHALLLLMDNSDFDMRELFVSYLADVAYIEMCRPAGGRKRSKSNADGSLATLMKATNVMALSVENKRECNTIRLMHIKLSILHLQNAARCTDSDNKSIYCLANVYSSMLHYVTGQFHRAMDHCMLVTQLKDHSKCKSYVARGNVLPKIEDEIDNVLGLVTLYRYVRSVTINRQQSSEESVFTSEFLAHYFIIKHLAFAKYQLAPITVAEANTGLMKNGICEQLGALRTRLLSCNFLSMSDLLLCKYQKNYSPRCRSKSAFSVVSLSGVEVIQVFKEFSIENLMKYARPRLHSTASMNTVANFHALSAYRCGLYEQCVQLCQQATRYVDHAAPRLSTTYYELIQLMDCDIVSFIGAAILLVRPTKRPKLAATVTLNRSVLTMYLMAQAQIKVFHVTKHVETVMASMCETLDKIAEVQLLISASGCLIDNLMLTLAERRIVAGLSNINGPFPFRPRRKNVDSVRAVENCLKSIVRRFV